MRCPERDRLLFFQFGLVSKSYGWLLRFRWFMLSPWWRDNRILLLLVFWTLLWYDTRMLSQIRLYWSLLKSCRCLMIDLRLEVFIGLGNPVYLFRSCDHLGRLFCGHRCWFCLSIWVPGWKGLPYACVDVTFSSSSLYLDVRAHHLISYLVIRVWVVTMTFHHTILEVLKFTALVRFDLLFLLLSKIIWVGGFRNFLVAFWNFPDLRQRTLF
jgi:hypothetical protein